MKGGRSGKKEQGHTGASRKRIERAEERRKGGGSDERREHREGGTNERSRTIKKIIKNTIYARNRGDEDEVPFARKRKQATPCKHALILTLIISN